MRLSLLFSLFPLFTLFSYVSSSPTEQTCSYCEGLSDSTCLIKLSGIVSSLDQSAKYDLYTQMYPSGRCNGMTEAQCVSTIEELLESLSDERKYKSFKTACTQDILVISNSDLSTCQLCDGMTTEYCSSTLTQLISFMTDSERLSYEKQVFNSHCQGLDDESCLNSLDYLMAQLSSSDSFTTIFQSCVDGQLNPAKISALKDTSDLSTLTSTSTLCSSCLVLSDTECFTLLNEKMASFDDKQRLTVLFDAFPEQQSSCLELTESQCLAKIERIAKSLPIQQRSTVLRQSCDTISSIADANGPDSSDSIIDAVNDLKKQISSNESPAELEVDSQPEQSECALCSGLSDLECHNVLSESMKSLDEKSRLELEQSILQNSCEGMTGKDCLTVLDDTLSAMDKTERFAALRDGCSKGLFPSTSLKIQDFGSSTNQPIGSFVVMIALVAMVAVGVTFYNRRRSLYSTIPEESEVELEI